METIKWKNRRGEEMSRIQISYGNLIHQDGTIEEGYWEKGTPIGEVIKTREKYILRE